MFTVTQRSTEISAETQLTVYKRREEVHIVIAIERKNVINPARKLALIWYDSV